MEHEKIICCELGLSGGKDCPCPNGGLGCLDKRHGRTYKLVQRFEPDIERNDKGEPIRMWFRRVQRWLR